MLGWPAGCGRGADGIGTQCDSPPRLGALCRRRQGFVQPLRRAGYTVTARDVDPEFGWAVAEFLKDPLPEEWLRHPDRGIISNPPFTLTERFVRKAIASAPYSAWLLRLNWLEGVGRKRLFEEHPPARIRISGRRLPCHRYGYTGPRAASNVAHAFFIFDASAGNRSTEVSWFDYREPELKKAA
jgi:hypothetical protein